MPLVQLSVTVLLTALVLSPGLAVADQHFLSMDFMDSGVSVEGGQPATLHCNVTGNPRPTVEWWYSKYHTDGRESKVVTRNEDPTSRAIILPDGSLYFFMVKPEDDGQYYCIASNGYDLVWSEGGFLDVETNADKLKIDIQPEDITVNTGEAATIKCVINDKWRTASTVVNWFHRLPDGKKYYNYRVITSQIDKTSRKLVLYDGSLRILDAQLDDAGDYECQVINRYGKIFSKTATLTVNGAGEPLQLKFLEEPTDVSTVAGKDLALRCKVTDHPNLRFEWWVKGKSSSGFQPVQRIRKISYYGTLHLAPVYLYDDGEYFCKVFSSSGASLTSRTAKVSVINEKPRTPTILKHPQNVTAKVGDNVILDCLPGTFVKVEYIQWRSPATHSLHKAKVVTGLQSKNKFMLLDGSLRIENIQLEDEGGYWCLVAGEHGSAKSNFAFVTVTQDVKDVGEWVPLFLGTLSSTMDNFTAVAFQFDKDGNFSKLPSGKNRAAKAAFHDGSVYYCGGSNQPTDYEDLGKDLTSECLILDGTGDWKAGPKMSIPRIDFTLNTVGDKLVAIGGQSGPNNDFEDTVEILEDGEWKAGPKISEARTQHCAIDLGNNNILVAGGSGLPYYKPLDLVEIFNIETGKSTRLFMPAEGATACALVGGTKLLVVVGTLTDMAPVYLMDLKNYLSAMAEGNESVDQLGDWDLLTAVSDWGFHGKLLFYQGAARVYKQAWTGEDASSYKYKPYNGINWEIGHWELETVSHTSLAHVDTILVPSTFRLPGDK